MAGGVDSHQSSLVGEWGVSSEFAHEDVVVALSEEDEGWIAVVAAVVEETVGD